MYCNRDIERIIRKMEGSFQVITVYGARQVGKSTTIAHLFPQNFETVSLDDPDQLFSALSNPKSFLDAHPWPLIIDEVQKAPILLDVIKGIVDRQRLVWLQNDTPKQLMYILSGSNQFELQQGISESLAGRTAVLNLASLTQIEKQRLNGNLFSPDIHYYIDKKRSVSVERYSRKDIFQAIFAGGMPDICINSVDRDLYFKSYINTYIEKDVRSLIAVDKELQFRNFLRFIALRTAQELNYEDISRNLGLNVETCKRWVSILQTSGIITLLYPYMANISKRIIKAPKCYFMDCGLCAYLCGWPDAQMLENGAMGGAFFETYVISEIIKSYYNAGKDPSMELYYYRDIDQKEIDLLHVESNAITPIEIKKGINPTKPNKNFKVLEKYRMEIKPGLIIDNADSIYAINEAAWILPIYLLGV